LAVHRESEVPKKKGNLLSQLQVMLQRKATHCAAHHAVAARPQPPLLLLPITTALLLWALGSCCHCHHMFPATAAGITIVLPLPLVPAHGGG